MDISLYNIAWLLKYDLSGLNLTIMSIRQANTTILP